MVLLGVPQHTPLRDRVVGCFAEAPLLKLVSKTQACFSVRKAAKEHCPGGQKFTFCLSVTGGSAPRPPYWGEAPEGVLCSTWLPIGVAPTGGLPLTVT